MIAGRRRVNRQTLPSPKDGDGTEIDRKSTIHVDQQRRQEEERGVQGKEHPQPHQQTKFRQGAHVRDIQGQKRQGRGNGRGKDAVAGIQKRQAQRLIGPQTRGPLRMEAVVKVNGIVGAQADDQRHEGK